MKLKSILFLMLGVLFSLTFAACDDDDDPVTHTDASVLVGGTFNGSMFDEDGNEKASDVVVTISKFEAENTQAITVKIASATLKMDQEAVFNVAKAGENRYTFGNGSAAAARNTGGVIEGNDFTVYTSLSSKFKFNATSSAKRYTIKAVKAGE